MNQVFQFLLAPQRADGVVLSGGKVHLYFPGTTNYKPVYTTRTYGVEAANPATLDANGTVQVFGRGLYDVEIKNAAGVTKFYWTDVAVGDATGAYYNADTDDFAATLTTIGATPTHVLMSVDQTISTAVVVPGSVTVIPVNGAKFVKSGSGSLTFTGRLRAGRERVFDDTFATGVTFNAGSVEDIFPEWFSETGGIKQAWVAGASTCGISLARKVYTETEKITATARGGRMRGVIGERNNATIKGSQIYFTFNDAFLEIGSDNGDPWDDADYDGLQLCQLSDLAIKYTGGTTTALSNGMGNYGTGTYGIRDWRGGHVRLQNVQFENLDYSLWGVQSDFDDLQNVTQLYCEHGVYAGPRSDQFNVDRLYSIYCTHALILDGCMAWINQLILKDCGHENKYPVLIKQYNDTKRSVHLERPWFEDYRTGTHSYVNAFVGIGTEAGYGGASIAADVTISKPVYYTNAQGSAAGYTKYIVEIGKGYVDIDSPDGDFSNILKLINFSQNMTNANASGRVLGRSYLASKCFDNTGGGTPDMYYNLYGQGGGFTTGSANRHFFRLLPENVNRNFALSTVTDKEFAVEYPDIGTDNNYCLRMKRRFFIGAFATGASPSSGTWDSGDFYTYTGFAAGGKMGKKCILGGTQNTYAQGLTATTDGSAVIVLSGVNTELKVGQYLEIGGTAAGAIISIATNGLSITMSQTTTVSGIANGAGKTIAYHAATFEEW